MLVSTEIPLAAVGVAVETASGGRRARACSTRPRCSRLAGCSAPRPGLRGPLLTPNVGELATLTGPGPTGVRRSGSPSADARAPVVVTLGGEGALVVEPADGRAPAAAPAPTVRDTTGAGDTFNGVLAAHLAAGATLLDAARAANVGAALSVGHVGARVGMPTADAIKLRCELRRITKRIDQ